MRQMKSQALGMDRTTNHENIDRPKGGRGAGGRASRWPASPIRLVGAIRRRAELFATGAMFLAATGIALAGPEGAQVVRGDVGITRNGAETVIRASNNSIINYRSFDIGRSETVRFVQPDAASRVLNRITGATPTRIDGSLISNGRVYLINPAGVYFSKGATINTAGLYAAAAKISDQHFLRGINQFTDASGNVVNEGTITSEFVGLIGKQVKNAGVINSERGTVVFGAGRDVFVGEQGGNIYVRVAGEAGAPAAESGSAAGTDPARSAGVVNTGRVNAKGGRVAFGSGDVFGTALFNSGTVRAKTVKMEGQGRGTVDLRGVVDASSATSGGGKVTITGEKVALRSATIDASGATGGGEVLVGGNFQGRGPERSAERTFISDDSTVRADATAQGDGGRVIVWADQTTGYGGTITARGAGAGGDGGFVEVSGKETLKFRGDVNVRGSQGGRDGTILLDPRDITISGAGADDGLIADNILDASDNGGLNAPPDATISASTIDGLSGNVVLQATRDIFVNSAVNLSLQGSGDRFTLDAGSNIAINASITTAGIVDLRADGAVTQSAAISSGGLLLRGGATFTLTNASNAVGTIAANITGAGSVEFLGNSALTIGTLAGTSGVTTNGGDAIIRTGGNLFVGPVSGPGTWVSTAGGAIQLTAGDTGAASPNAGAVLSFPGGIVSAGGNIRGRTQGSGGILIDNSIDAGSGSLVFQAAGGNIVQSGGAITAATLLSVATSGGIDLAGAANDFDTIASSSAGGFNIFDTDGVTIGQVTNAFDGAQTVDGISTTNSGVQIIAINAGDVAITRQISTGTGGITLAAIDGSVTQTSTGVITGAAMDVSASDNIALGAAANDVDAIAGAVGGSMAYRDSDGFDIASLANDGIVAGTNLSLDAGGAVTQSAKIEATGLELLGAGPFTLTFATNDVDTIAGNLTGGAAFTDTDDLAIGTVNTVGLTSTGDITLNTGGALTQTQDLAAAGLELLGSGPVTLNRVGNTWTTLAANITGDTTLAEADGFAIGTLNATNGLTVGGVLSLSSGGAVTQSEAISATDLLLLGDGPFALTNGLNSVTTLAADTAGAVLFTNNGALTVGTVGTTSGITTQNSPLVLTAPSITVLQQINGNGVSLRADAMTFTAGVSSTAAGINIRTLTVGESIGLGGAAGTLQLSEAALLSLSAPGGSVTIGDNAGGLLSADALALGTTDYSLNLRGQQVRLDDLALSAGTSLTLAPQSAGAIQAAGTTITVENLILLGAGDFILDGLNDFDTVAGNVVGTNADVAIRDTDGFAFSSSGLALTGTLILDSAGAVTQGSGTAITANALRLLGSGPYTLTGSGNDFNTFAASTTGAILVRDVDDLAIGTVGGANGVTTTGLLSIEAGGAVTQTQAVSANLLELRGAGPFTLSNSANAVSGLAATVSGPLTLFSSSDLTLVIAGSSAGVTSSGPGGAVDISTAGDLRIDQAVAGATSVTLHSGTDGTGDMFFGDSLSIAGADITLRAGDGTGGAGTGAVVRAAETAPAGGVPVLITGVAGGASTPTSLVIRQDGTVVDAVSLPRAVQFGDGSTTPAGVVYTIRSDDGAVNLGTATKVAGSDLTLQSFGATGGVNVSANLSLLTFTLDSTQASTLLGVSTTGQGSQGAITVNSPSTIGGDLITQSRPIVLGAVATLVGGSRIIDAGGSFVVLGDGLDHGTNDVLLTAAEIEILDTIAGSGQITLQPWADNGSIRLGDASGTNPTSGVLDLTAVELGRIATGHGRITIGRAGGAGTTTIAASLTFSDPLVLRQSGLGGLVRLDNTLTGTGDASITIEGSSDLGTILAGNIVTNGQPIIINGPLAVAGDFRLDATNGGTSTTPGGVTVTGAIDREGATPVNSARLRIFSGAGATDLQGNVGGVSRLYSLSIDGATIRVRSVSTISDQDYLGDVSLGGILNANGAGSVSGRITIDGDVELFADSAIVSALTGTDDVRITGGIGSNSSTSSRGLILRAGAGDVFVLGASGTPNRLGDLRVEGATLDLGSFVTNGAMNLSGSLICLRGDTYSGIDLTFAGPVELKNNVTMTATNLVVFNSTIESDNGLRTLTTNAIGTRLVGAVGATTGRELGAFTSTTGATGILGGSVRTRNGQTYGTQVTLGQDTTLTSLDGGNITFGGSVDSLQTGIAGPGPFRLTSATTGTTVFGGSVGFFDPSLRSLTVNGRTRIGGTTVRTTEGQTYTGAVDLASDTTLTASTVTFGSTIDSFDSTARRLTISAPSGVIALNGDAGSARPLSTVTLTGSSLNLSGVRTTGDQTYNGAQRLSRDLVAGGGTIRLNGATTLTNSVNIGNNGASGASGVNVIFANTVNSLAGNPAAGLTVRGGSTGAVQFNGVVGSTADQRLSVLVATGSTIELQAVTTLNGQVYQTEQGVVSLNGNLTVSQLGDIAILGNTIIRPAVMTIATGGGNVEFIGDVSSGGTPNVALTINTTSNGGRTFFGGGVGGQGSSGALGSITTDADGRTLFGAGSVRTTGAQTYRDVVALQGVVEFRGGTGSQNIVFERTLDSDSSGTPAQARFTLNSGAIVDFQNNVGSIQPLASLAIGPVTSGVNTGIAAKIGGNITATNGITIDGETRLATDSVMNAGTGSFFFGDIIYTDTSRSTPASLTLFSNASPVIDADFPTTNDRLDVIPFKFRGSIGVAPTTGAVATHNYRLSNLLISRNVSELSLPPNDPSAIPASATIVFSRGLDSQSRITRSAVGGTDAFTINTTNAFTMGFTQKLTSFGPLTIASGGAARIGDLASTGSITVDAPSITILRRAATSIFDNVIQNPDRFDPKPDAGVDIVANGAINFRVVPTVDGVGPNPQFARPANQAIDPEISGFTVRDFGAVVDTAFLGNFEDSRTRGTSATSPFLLGLDLKAEGASIANSATALAGALPRDTEFREVTSSTYISRALRDPLERMGISVMDLDADLMVEFLLGRSLYVDSFARYESDNPQNPAGVFTRDLARDYRVSAGRLQSRPVLRALGIYLPFAFEPETDASGAAVVDELGNTRYDIDRPRWAIHQGRLAEAWSDFVATLANADAAAAKGSEFRIYLEAKSASDEKARAALEIVRTAEEFFAAIDATGLSGFEASIPKQRFLNDLKPASMTIEQLRTTIGDGRVASAR